MNRETQKLNWLKVLLAILAAIALSVIYIYESDFSGIDAIKDLIMNVIPNLVAVLVAIPVIYFLFTRMGISPQKELEDNIVDRIASVNGNRLIINEIDNNQVKEEIISSNNIIIMGMHLSTSVQVFRNSFRKAILRKKNIKFILMDWRNEDTLSYSIERYSDMVNVKTEIDKIKVNFDQLKELKLSALDKKKAKVSINLIDYPIPFGAFVFDFGTSKCRIYIKTYGYKTSPLSFQKMILTKNDGELFNNYNKQIQEFLDKSDEVE